MAKVALLIGVSEYEAELRPLPAAVRDLTAMYQVLTDPNKGSFDEVKILRNPHSQEISEEIEALFSDRHRDDLVLLFFSGHGLKDGNGHLYFSGRNTRGNRLKSTAVAADFIHRVMRECRAKRQGIILDCCFSGAFDPALQAKADGSVDLEGQLGAEGRVVLTSCSSIQYAFEQEGNELSIYTQYLVEGIATGAADRNGDGNISMLESHDYASEKVKQTIAHMTPKIITLKDKGFDIVLAKAIASQTTDPVTGWGELSLGAASTEVTFLRNSLDVYNPLISGLIQRLTESAKLVGLSRNPSLEDTPFENHLLTIIRLVSQANFVCILTEIRQDTWIVKATSDFEGEANQTEYLDHLKRQILPRFSYESIFNSNHHGIYTIDQDQKLAGAIVLVRLEVRPQAEFMIICGIHHDSYLLGDAYGKILSTFYKTNRKAPTQSLMVEAAILDALKQAYGFVSPSLYERRFDLFCQRLKQMIVHFEPILHFDEAIYDLEPEEIFEIRGWEALARDPDNLTAPFDLFQAAEMWGPRFIVELDQHFLDVATQQYREALKISGIIRNPRDIKPLSVNVYPESLMRNAYFKAAEKIRLGKEGSKPRMPPNKLILEISEKTQMPKFQDGMLLRDPLQAFRRRLEEFSRILKVQFAIDDFGVGYASVSRLAGLRPSHIKVDREILHHDAAEVILRFVLELAQTNTLNPLNVIVEGLDDKSPISLQRLREIGINHVQGHIFGKASTEVYSCLSREKAEMLKASLSGKTA
jgi:EAL domain-containing protein (putative c-di-GMP-specific phosphodiesterase class I)